MSSLFDLTPPRGVNAVERLVGSVVARSARRREGVPFDVHDARAQQDRFIARLRAPKGVGQTDDVIAGVPVVRSTSGNGDRGTVVSFFGGAYVTGSARGISFLAARDGGPDVVSVGYRRSPEHPHPAAVDDALAVYRQLVSTVGADRLVISGESAGGGLALRLVQRAGDEGLPMPAGIVAFYPWGDMSLTGASWTTNRGRDVLTYSQIVESVQMHAGGLDPADPALSPLFGSFADFPPTYIAVGTRDMLLDDARQLTARMHEAGVDVRLDVFEGAVHGFNVVPLPTGRSANARARAFIDAVLPRRLS